LLRELALSSSCSRLFLLNHQPQHPEKSSGLLLIIVVAVITPLTVLIGDHLQMLLVFHTTYIPL
jgi:hypothetical protein